MQRICTGVLVFLLPVLTLFLFSPIQQALEMILLAVSWIGIFTVADGVRINRGKDSVLSSSHRWRLSKMVVVFACFGLFLELFGTYFTKLWYYPGVHIPTYAVLAIPAFIFYGLTLVLLYEIFDTHNENSVEGTGKTYARIIYAELYLGSVGMIISIIYLYQKAVELPVKLWKIGVNPGTSVAFWLPFLAMVSLFFIFEYFCFKQRQKTLTFDLLHGDRRPIVAIFIATVLAVLLIEYVNVPFNVWEFANWPSDNLRLFGIPVAALFAWPFQFFTLLSMLRFALDPDELKIW